MANVVGGPQGDPRDRQPAALAAVPGAHLHLYGKRSRPARKIGHVTVLGDELVATRPAWQAAMKSPRHVSRHDMPDADQTYSTLSSRREVIDVARQWMLDPQSPLGDGPAPVRS